MAIEDFTFVTKRDNIKTRYYPMPEVNHHICQNLNPFTQHFAMNIAGFTFVPIFNFIVTKALRLRSNETNNNYLFIVNLINKFNNLRNQEFNYFDRKML